MPPIGKATHVNPVFGIGSYVGGLCADMTQLFEILKQRDSLTPLTSSFVKCLSTTEKRSVICTSFWSLQHGAYTQAWNALSVVITDTSAPDILLLLTVFLRPSGNPIQHNHLHNYFLY